MGDESVRVAVRIRPLVTSEVERGCSFALDLPHTNQVHVVNTDKGFTFDHVFGPKSKHEQVYEMAVQDMVQNVFKGKLIFIYNLFNTKIIMFLTISFNFPGYNVTILAYGQTGSGKTYSMGTNYAGEDSTGIIPRAVREIFQSIETKKSEWTFKVTISFMELYNEQLYDLLSEKSRKDCIVDIREEAKNIKIVGITEKEVTEAEQTLQLLVTGSAGRATGATAMNEQSSRSHAIFTITILQQKIGDPDSATTSKFHLVDLAGSERSKKTGATGNRFKEGVNINKGLLALGNVISQLSESGNSFVGYRDSKLTRLLQDSLGGNSMTLLIACVSPADYNLEETLSTLRYADRAKKIKNKPIINQEPKTAEINRLTSIIKDLRLALLNQGGIFSCPPEHNELAEKNKGLAKKLRELTEQFNINILEAMCVNERAELAEKAKLELQEGLMKIVEDFDEILKQPELLTGHREALETIYKKIVELLNIHKNMDVELQQLQPGSFLTELHDSSSILTVSISESSELDEQTAEHTLLQSERNNEIQSINRAVALKEELVAKLLENVTQLEKNKVIEMEEEIKALQAEKEQYLKNAENTSNSTSTKVQALAESRRKKVQELEKKITELTRKCTEQNRIIKAKEKSDTRIKNLDNEIQSMKQTRVQLVRQMRKESEKFSQWKLIRERELHKLKEQDRKRQNQIVRLQTQHNKQTVVFKRKMEEACAINKRLKDALEMRKKAGIRRDKMNSNSKDGINTWIDQELNTLLSTVDAECTLDKLRKYREVLVKNCDELRAENAENPTNERTTTIEDLAAYIELRNDQISELEQKIIESDQENRANTRWAGISNIGDAKMALKHLFSVSADNEKKYIDKCWDYDELMGKYDAALTDLRILQLKEKARLEQQQLQNNTIEKDLMIEKLKAQLQGQKPPKKRNIQELHNTSDFDYNILDMTDDSLLEVDDPDKDPDYRNTPMHKRLRTSNSKDITDENIKERKNRTSDSIRCQCKTTACATRLCTCRKNFGICTNACGCDPSRCENKDKENVAKKFFPDVTNANLTVDSN